MLSGTFPNQLTSKNDDSMKHYSYRLIMKSRKREKEQGAAFLHDRTQKRKKKEKRQIYRSIRYEIESQTSQAKSPRRRTPDSFNSGYIPKFRTDIGNRVGSRVIGP